MPTSSLCNFSRRRSAKTRHNRSRLGLVRRGRVSPQTSGSASRSCCIIVSRLHHEKHTPSIGAYAELCSPTLVLTCSVDNRKLSGAFLLASRLRATVDCKELWDGVTDSYKFSTDL